MLHYTRHDIFTTLSVQILMFCNIVQIPISRFFRKMPYGMSAGKKYQIDKKIFFQLINVLNQITNFTSFLLKNIFLKKISIWYFFPTLTPFCPVCYQWSQSDSSFEQTLIEPLLVVARLR